MAAILFLVMMGGLELLLLGSLMVDLVAIAFVPTVTLRLVV